MTRSRTCFLHIGTPKTGSTSIQGFIHLNRAVLFRHGVDAPLFPEGYTTRGARVLAEALSEERDPEAPVTASWRWLDRHLRQSDRNVLISSETFWTRIATPDRIAFTHAFFRRRGYRVKTVAYVRDSVGYLNAMYTQRAKKLRLAEPFADWADELLASRGRTASYSYWRTVSRLLAEDGLEVVVRPLDRLAPGGLIPDFLNVLGLGRIDSPAYDDGPFRNATPGPRAIAVSNRMAALLRAHVPGRAIQPLTPFFRMELESLDWAERPFFGPDAALAERIRERFSADNERLAAQMWGTGWEVAEPPLPKAQNVFDPTCATPEDRAAMDEFVRSFFVRHVPFWRRPAQWLGLKRIA